MIDKYENQVDCINPDRKIEVYRNLHKDCWSVRQDGIVRFHCNTIYLKDCAFVVQPAGRAKVLREKKKNVHAFVEGTITKNVSPIAEQIKYNPYRLPFFHTEDGTKVETRNIAILQTRENKTPSIQGW